MLIKHNSGHWARVWVTWRTEYSGLEIEVPEIESSARERFSFKLTKEKKGMKIDNEMDLERENLKFFEKVFNNESTFLIELLNLWI